MRRMYSENQLDSQIKEVIEGGQVDNAKPIYCHPISFYASTINNLRFGCLIFDNNPTPYTWTTFKEKVFSISKAINEVARIVSTGGWITSSGLCVSQVLDVNYASNYMRIYGLNGSDYTVNLDITNATPDEFYDAINKIN